MDCEVVHKILSELKKCHLVDTNCSEEDFFTILFEESNKRLDILKWLLCQFSEDIESDLEKEPNLKYGIAEILHELQFTKSAGPDKLSLRFVMARCSREEQEEVFGKIFEALDGFWLYKQTQQDCKIKQSHVYYQPKYIEGVKPVFDKSGKAFDYNKANRNLEEATKLIERYTLDKMKPCDEMTDPVSQPMMSRLTATDLSELNSVCKYVGEWASDLKPSNPTADCQPSLSFETAIESFADTLHSFTETYKELATDKIETSGKIDTKKMLDSINEYKKNSIVNKIKDTPCNLNNV